MSKLQRNRPFPRQRCEGCQKLGLGHWEPDWYRMVHHRECRYCHKVYERPMLRTVKEGHG
jgi:hypothetical protein